jgi:hypothetical protein
MQEDHNRSSHSAYELLKDFGVPVVLGIGTILNAESPARFTSLLIATVLLGSLGAWPRLSRALRNRRDRSRDERFAYDAFPRFRGFVSRFGDFVSTNHCDTLHYIVTKDFSKAAQEALLVYYSATPVEHWSSLWEHFDQRVRRQVPAFAELSPLIQEFNSLIGQYHAYCLGPIYDRMGDDLRAKLSDADLRKLRTFQQKHQAFMIEYTEFLRALSQSHPALEHLPRYLPVANAP